MKTTICALALLASATAANAQFADSALLDLSDPKIMVSAMQQAGYKAELKTNKAGEPYIASAVNGSSFTIEFYGCTGMSKCGSYQFQSWYKAEPLFTAALANDWNKVKRFIKLAVNDDGELIEYMDMTATGKTTYAQFADVIDWYQVMDAEVGKFVMEKKEAKK